MDLKVIGTYKYIHRLRYVIYFDNQYFGSIQENKETITTLGYDTLKNFLSTSRHKTFKPLKKVWI